MIGTNNSAICDNNASCSASPAGQEWYQVGAAVASYVTGQGWSWQVSVNSADDVEPGFDAQGPSLQFLIGFNQADAGGPYPLRMEDYGSADGCEPYGTCDNGWTEQDVVDAAYGYTYDYPLPEIYNGAMAREWRYMRADYSVYMDGVMGDCNSSDPIPSWGAPCYDKDGNAVNDDTEAWGAGTGGNNGLWYDLNASGHPQRGLDFLTNIRWTS